MQESKEICIKIIKIVKSNRFPQKPPLKTGGFATNRSVSTINTVAFFIFMCFCEILTKV